MKIVFDSQIFAAQKYGGVSRYYCEIASRLAVKSDVNVSITAPMHINAYLKKVPKDIVSGFRAPDPDRTRALPGEKYLRMMLRGTGLLMGDAMLRIMKPDIIHETYFSPFRLGGQHPRRVLTIYDMIHEKFASNFPGADKSARYKKLAAARADHVICISESTRRDAIDILGLHPDKTSVIYLGFDLMNSDNFGEETVAIPIRKPYLLYVGNRGGYKNFLFLLQAYGASNRLRSGYRLVCFGGGAFNAEELAVIQQLGLSGKQVLQLAGDDHMLTRMYENADVFVYPSLYEGFGIPPLEAMSHDCPVLCSNTSSIPEVVGEAGEYFDPYDQDSILAAIKRVITSNSHKGSLIERGRERLTIFSWERCATETLNVYKQLL